MAKKGYLYSQNRSTDLIKSMNVAFHWAIENVAQAIVNITSNLNLYKRLEAFLANIFVFFAPTIFYLCFSGNKTMDKK